MHPRVNNPAPLCAITHPCVRTGADHVQLARPGPLRRRREAAQEEETLQEGTEEDDEGGDSNPGERRRGGRNRTNNTYRCALRQGVLSPSPFPAARGGGGGGEGAISSVHPLPWGLLCCIYMVSAMPRQIVHLCSQPAPRIFTYTWLPSRPTPRTDYSQRPLMGINRLRQAMRIAPLPPLLFLAIASYPSCFAI